MAIPLQEKLSSARKTSSPGLHWHHFSGMDPRVTCLAVSADGRCLAIGGGGTTETREDKFGIVLCSLDDGMRTHRLGDHKRSLKSLQFTPDGHGLISMAEDRSLWVWDLTRGTVRHEWKTYAKTFALMAEGKHILLQDNENTQCVRDLATGRKILRIVELPDYFTAMALDPSGKMLACLDGSPVIHLWDLKTRRERVPTTGHEAAIDALEMTPDGRHWISLGCDKTLRGWESQTGKEVSRCQLGAGSNSMTVAPDGSQVVTSYSSGTFVRWQMPRGKYRSAFQIGERGKLPLAYLPDGRHLLCGTDALLRIVDHTNGNDVALLKGHDQEIRSVAATPNGKWLLSTCDDGDLRFWDSDHENKSYAVRVCEPRLSFNGGPPVFSVVASPDSRFAAVHLAKEIRLYDIATRQEVDRYPHQAKVIHLSYSADSRTIATVDANGRVHLWELASGKERASFATNAHHATCGAFSRDGRSFATGGDDTTILVWDLSAGSAAKKHALTAAQHKAAWEALAGDDAAAAYAAIWLLAADPRAPEFLNSQLRPATEPTKAQQAELLAALDADTFAERERASTELDFLTDNARLAMRQESRTNHSAEVRRRLREALEHLDEVHPPRELLRRLRALEALELANTPEALTLAKRLADGAPARLTREAQVTARRLQSR